MKKRDFDYKMNEIIKILDSFSQVEIYNSKNLLDEYFEMSVL